jgi:predicted  nucleic acid-binding Zn-ribbon protein
VNADPDAQVRLLDLADHDLHISQLQHKRRTLPDAQRAQELRQRLDRLNAEVIAAETIVSDLAREQARADADVELVRERVRKDQALLTEINDAKQLQSLQNELESLARRQSELEDIELEVMERAEGAAAAVRVLTEEREQVTTDLEMVDGQVAEQYADIDAQLGAQQAERDALASSLPDDLLALYEKIRVDNGGVGAARLERGRCAGCQLEVPPHELEDIRNAPPERVVRCEECRRILIRESAA